MCVSEQSSFGNSCYFLIKSKHLTKVGKWSRFGASFQSKYRYSFNKGENIGTKNNVNPDHYKTAGRERPGQDINQEINKQKFAQAQAEQRIQNKQGGSAFIPGGGNDVATKDTPDNEPDTQTGQATESADSSGSK